MDDIGERLRENGWRQGVIVPASHVLEGLPDGSPATADDYVMVVSQSCDLVHHDLNKEPSAVFLVLKSITSVTPDVLHGRNPRLIHFSATAGQSFAAWAWNQVVIPREDLAERKAEPSFELEAKVLRYILDWLAKRFTRIAFPDTFNDALDSKSKAIRSLLKKTHQIFSEILLHVEPFEELKGAGSYELACYLLMPPEIHDDPQQLASARAVAAKLEALFAACGMEVVECSPVSELNLSVAELKELVRWDYDHLTHRETTRSEPSGH